MVCYSQTEQALSTACRSWCITLNMPFQLQGIPVVQDATSRKRSVEAVTGALHRAQPQVKNLLSASCAARTRRGSSRLMYCEQAHG